MSRATQRKMMLFGKSFSDLSQLMPAQSFEPPSAGTTNVPEIAVTAQTVIGSDTPPTPTPAAPQSKRLTKEQVDRLPYFVVCAMTCCGYMDVSGLQDALYSDRSVEDILLGLAATIRRQYKHWLSVQEKIDEKYRAMSKLSRAKEGGWMTEYNALAAEVRQMELERGQEHKKINVAGAFLFTFVTDYKKCDFTNKLKEFVKRHQLGDVTEVPAFYNPNSSNGVISVILGLRREAFAEFVNKRLPPEE